MKNMKNTIKRVKKTEKSNSIDLSIGPNDGHNRSETQKAEIETLARLHNVGRTAERLRKNDMLAVQYRMEHYTGDDQISYEKIISMEDFVMDFLAVLGITKTAFAGYIEMDAANLNKYLKGDRRFNTELALKFAYFFHTPADLWLKVQIKNELLQLQKEKEAADKYLKYDYEKVLHLS